MRSGLIRYDYTKLAFQTLNPADHFTLMMDHEIRKSGLAGNYCAIVLKLDGAPDAEQLRDKCSQFSLRFPQASARLTPSGKQFSWRQTSPPSIPFCDHHAQKNAEESSAETLIEEILNASAPISETAPLEMHLISEKQTSHLILRWFHPLCDAKGVELVLYHMLLDSPLEQDEQGPALSRLLSNWSLWQKIKLGWLAKQNVKQLGQSTSILPPLKQQAPQIVKSRVFQFSPSDSQQIMRLARKHTGLAGTALYFIGCMMRTLDQNNPQSEGEAYCVPYAMNLRRRKALFPLFGNQVSFLFAQASKQTVQSRQILFNHLRNQNKDAIKRSLDRAMLPLMQAGSWLSLDKYGQIVRNAPDGRERSSFWFSYTGSMDPEPQMIAGCKINQLYQFSQVTAPPSLGLLVSQFQGQVVLSYNYVSNHFSETWIDTTLKTMAAELLEQDLAEQ